MDIIFSALSIPKSGAVVIAVADHLKLSAKAQELDKKTDGAIKRALKAKGFKGNKGEALTLFSPSGLKLDAIILIGLGKEKELDALKLQQIGGKILTTLNAERIKEAAFLVEEGEKSKRGTADIAANLAYGAQLRSYRFDKYRTKEKDDTKPTLKTLSFLLKSAKDAESEYKTLRKIADGVFLARDVVSEPPNVIYPESYARRIKDELTKLGVEVEILGKDKMAQLGMGALLGVGQGSAKESKLVVMKWNGLKKGSKDQPIAFVGKGVTFDTGGISIKPSAGMEDMKYDMGGSAAVVGLIKALAGRKAKVNAVGVVGLVENMPDGNAQRPSDIVHTMSGQTVEVLNTDAEGRLVLADALWYCQDRFKPKFMIDLATLTGAIVIALGESSHAGMFSNNDELCKKLSDCGEKVGERVWRFPMGENYDRMIDSKVADMQNISNGRGAGSITAAQFLQRFVNDTPWAHLDIAGVAWAKKDSELAPEGATAFGVRLLNKLVAEHYEK